MRRTLIAAAAAALLAGAGLAPGSPAQAYDGRAVSPGGELRSVHLYALDRAPDRRERSVTLRAADGNCKAAVLGSSYATLTGREAARNLRTPQRQTNAVYLALLDRAPDPAGWAMYLAVNRVDGIGRSTIDIMASPEYRNRLARVCAGRPSSTATVYRPDEVTGVVQSLLGAAAVGSTGCAVTPLAARMRSFRDRAGLASVAAHTAQVKATPAAGPACTFAKRMALAATWTAAVGSTGVPVYVDQAMRTTVGATTRTVHYTFTIGRTPADTRQFEAALTAPR
jgi:hypothetical protein